MKIGIIQSSFIPWRGYFDFIGSVDAFVLYEDVQYSKGSWRNRNKIKCAEGTRWMTVPVRHRSLNQLILNTEIDDRKDWRLDHFAQWHAAYASAPFFATVKEILGDLGRSHDSTISQLNIRLIRLICAYLSIPTPLLLSSDLQIQGHGTRRLIQVLQSLGAKTYLSGPTADGYLEKDLFRQAGIRLEYKSYDYASYPQLWGTFVGSVSVLDLIANCGPKSRTWLHSKTPDEVIVP